jgi:hypothetical protein
MYQQSYYLFSPTGQDSDTFVKGEIPQHHFDKNFSDNYCLKVFWQPTPKIVTMAAKNNVKP